MNALGEQFRCVLLLTTTTTSSSSSSSSNCVAVDAQELAGDDDPAVYGVTSVMPVAGAVAAPLAAQVAAHIHNFCDSHNIPLADWGTDTASLLAAAHERSLKHVSVLHCNAAELAGVRRQLLSLRNPIILLLELACDGALPCGRKQDEVSDMWLWLRPTPSCFAELQQMGVHGETAFISVAMRCSYPIVRATPPSSCTATCVTMDGLLREVGYKVGRLPKYGA